MPKSGHAEPLTLSELVTSIKRLMTLIFFFYFFFAGTKEKVAKRKVLNPAVKTSMFLTPAAHVHVRRVQATRCFSILPSRYNF